MHFHPSFESHEMVGEMCSGLEFDGFGSNMNQQSKPRVKVDTVKNPSYHWPLVKWRAVTSLFVIRP